MYVHPKDAAAEAAAAAAAGGEAEGDGEVVVEEGSAGAAAAATSADATSPGAAEAAEAAAAAAAAAAAKPEGEGKLKKEDSSSSSSSDCIFHILNKYDYQGRSWLCAPSSSSSSSAAAAAASSASSFGASSSSTEYFLPKREVCSLVGHCGGVQTLRLFPTTNHLLLSASFDSTIKIWGEERNKNNTHYSYNNMKWKCKCTYTAHSQAVRDIQFDNDGRHFYSCGYDGYIKLWDTEVGKVVKSFKDKGTPYCVSVHSGDNNIFIIGSNSRKAVQYDARSGDITVEYTEHLGPVNTVSFCEDNKRIATTSDDKKLFIWEFGIPVVTKHIADPDMFSMPSACIHPSSRYISFQSMNNTIYTYEAFGRFRFIPKRKFIGHLSSGFAVKPSFSPDGRYIISGDSTGRLFFWSFKTTKLLKTFKAHQKVCMHALWLPYTSSTVFSCGWDGIIKIWD